MTLPKPKHLVQQKSEVQHLERLSSVFFHFILSAVNYVCAAKKTQSGGGVMVVEEEGGSIARRVPAHAAEMA